MCIAYYAFVICSALKQICRVVLASIFTGMIVLGDLFIYLFNFKSYLKQKPSRPLLIGDLLYFPYIENYYNTCCVAKSYRIQ